MSDMNKEGNPDSRVKTGIYHAPWEKSFDKILTPFEEFIHRQTTSGLLLMGTAVLALVLANGPLVSVYEHLVHTLIGLNMGSGLGVQEFLAGIWAGICFLGWLTMVCASLPLAFLLVEDLLVATGILPRESALRRKLAGSGSSAAPRRL